MSAWSGWWLSSTEPSGQKHMDDFTKQLIHQNVQHELLLNDIYPEFDFLHKLIAYVVAHNISTLTKRSFNWGCGDDPLLPVTFESVTPALWVTSWRDVSEVFFSWLKLLLNLNVSWSELFLCSLLTVHWTWPHHAVLTGVFDLHVKIVSAVPKTSSHLCFYCSRAGWWKAKLDKRTLEPNSADWRLGFLKTSSLLIQLIKGYVCHLLPI